MKFTCERCSAQYMISDEKVGPAGVKVRCKKCGNVIHVKRTEAGAADAPAPAAAATPGPGLDAELGQAFDSAFGGGESNPDATQAMTSDDAAKIATAAEPPSGEWYVAIGQAQVGPLPLSEVKKKWEGGEIGPDSLVWRPGMGDWVALSSVQDLNAYLAPFARAARVSRPAMEAARDGAPRYGTATSMPAASSPSTGGTPARGTAAPADPAWKPAGASALAALASEEIAARNAPEPARPAASAAKPGGGSLVDAMNLPDGGVDPTGALPLAIKGMEKTGERKVSSIAATAAKQRRSRGVLVGVVVTLLLALVGAAAAVFTGLVHVPGLELGRPAPAVAIAPTPAPIAAPTPVLRPPEVAAAPAPPAPEPAKAEPPKPEAEPPKAEPPRARPEPVAVAPEPRRTTRESRTKAGRREAVARADPAPAAPSPQAPAKKGGGGVLDFDDSDTALKEALGGSAQPSGRSVYVPPASGGGGGSLPDKVSTAQIQEAVAGRVDSLRRCVSEQKAREPDATGVLKMAWTIAGDGTPKDVRCVTPEYASGQFAACIGGVIRNIRFPRSQTAGQQVTFPFSF